jgi:hypothetical protein
MPSEGLVGSAREIALQPGFCHAHVAHSGRRAVGIIGAALKTTLKAEIDPEAWATLNSDTSRPFDRPEKGRIAVKVINHLGDEVMKVFRG